MPSTSLRARRMRKNKRKIRMVVMWVTTLEVLREVGMKAMMSSRLREMKAVLVVTGVAPLAEEE
jgi:hypothetical protein